MNLRDILQLDQSRNNVDQVIKMVRDNPALFDSLWSIFKENENPISRRALWAIDILTENQPFLSESHLETLIQMLQTSNHDGLKRHSLRILERNVIPESYKGILVSVCFKWLEDSSSPVAVKMFSLKILSDVAVQEPVLARELIDIIELQLVNSTPGFKSIAYKIIRKLQKEIGAQGVR